MRAVDTRWTPIGARSVVMRVRLDLGRGAAGDVAVPGSSAVSDRPPEPWPPLAPVVTPPLGRLGLLALVLAGLSLALYLVGAILLTLPVETPGVQDCGAPGAYLLDGRLDRIPDPEGRILDADGEIVTLDPDVAAVARETPCQERVAARAVPAGGLILAGTVVGVAAFALELVVVRPRQRRRIRAEAEAQAPVPPPAPAPWGVPPGDDGG